MEYQNMFKLCQMWELRNNVMGSGSRIHMGTNHYTMLPLMVDT